MCFRTVSLHLLRVGAGSGFLLAGVGAGDGSLLTEVGAVGGSLLAGGCRL